MEAVETTALDELQPVQEQPERAVAPTNLFSRDPELAYQEAERLVGVVARRCNGPGYLVDIRGKKYPKIEWWTTVAASLGLFPRTVFAKRLEREAEIAYEARVEVHHQGRVISAGEALCSNLEARWQNADEYAIKSMAITRASGKAYRIPLSFLAVMAGLEATPAEEIPAESRDHGSESFPVRPKPSKREEPATQRQIQKLQELAQDTRIPSEERKLLNDELSMRLCKSKASQILDHYFGRSEFRDGKWTKVTQGALGSTAPATSRTTP